MGRTGRDQRQQQQDRGQTFNPDQRMPHGFNSEHIKLSPTNQRSSLPTSRFARKARSADGFGSATGTSCEPARNSSDWRYVSRSGISGSSSRILAASVSGLHRSRSSARSPLLLLATLMERLIPSRTAAAVAAAKRQKLCFGNAK